MSVITGDAISTVICPPVAIHILPIPSGEWVYNLLFLPAHPNEHYIYYSSFVTGVDAFDTKLNLDLSTAVRYEDVPNDVHFCSSALVNIGGVNYLFGGWYQISGRPRQAWGIDYNTLVTSKPATEGNWAPYSWVSVSEVIYDNFINIHEDTGNLDSYNFLTNTSSVITNIGSPDDWTRTVGGDYIYWIWHDVSKFYIKRYQISTATTIQKDSSTLFPGIGTPAGNITYDSITAHETLDRVIWNFQTTSGLHIVKFDRNLNVVEKNDVPFVGPGENTLFYPRLIGDSNMVAMDENGGYIITLEPSIVVHRLDRTIGHPYNLGDPNESMVTCDGAHVAVATPNDLGGATHQGTNIYDMNGNYIETLAPVTCPGVAGAGTILSTVSGNRVVTLEAADVNLGPDTIVERDL